MNEDLIMKLNQGQSFKLDATAMFSSEILQQEHDNGPDILELVINNGSTNNQIRWVTNNY